MNESTNETAPPASLIELGGRLAAARAARGWEIDEVAHKLHLPLATLNDLEAGRADRIGTPLYLKGFLRSYLKLMGLPEGWSERAIQGSAAVAAPPILPAAGAVARRVSWLERYKWAASYVVGTALALTAVHWLVSNTPQLGFPDAQRTTLPVPPPPVEVAVVAEQPPSAPTVAPLGPVLAPAVTSTSNSDEAPVMASLSPFSRVAVDGPAGTVVPAPLELSFDQDSWVEVRNSTGEPLLYEVVRAGQKRAFSDGAPFSVRIGNVRGVRATVTGTDLDLNSFARGNVARFEVAQRDGAWQALSRNSEPTGTTRDGG